MTYSIAFGVIAGLPLVILRSFRESTIMLLLGAIATIAVSVLVVAAALADEDVGLGGSVSTVTSASPQVCVGD